MGTATRHTHRPHKKTQPIPGWAWLATGLAIGLFVAFLVYLGRMPGTSDEVQLSLKETADLAPQEISKSSADKKSDKFAPLPPVESEYGFYTELLTMEVEVPVEDPLAASPAAPSSKPVPRSEPEQVARGERSTPAPAAKPRQVYVLQLPSFKSYRAADSLKARLALMGVVTTVQPVSVGSKEKWYRLRAGPYGTSGEAAAVQQRLRREQVPSVLLKLSK